MCCLLPTTSLFPCPPPLQAPPEDGSELRLALNRAQRQCLKLSSKLSKAQEEAAERCVRVRLVEGRCLVHLQPVLLVVQACRACWRQGLPRCAHA